MLYEVITEILYRIFKGTKRVSSHCGATGLRSVGNWTMIARRFQFKETRDDYRHQPRITSYNVCYTKLLRGVVLVDHQKLLDAVLVKVLFGFVDN